MRKFQCELCGSVDFVKIDDNLFQCQYCGCKYSSAEVKKILFGEVTFKSQDYEVIAGKLIKYNGSSTDIVIPDNVSVIGEGVFSVCPGITSVSIPDSVKVIESNAFNNCTSLQSILIPDSVCEMQSYAFSNCTGLKTIKLSNSLRIIESYAFQNCSSLNSIVLPVSVCEIKNNAFYGCNGLLSIEFPDNLCYIGDYAFRKCSSLKQVILPNAVKRIGKYAFADCSSLESVTIPPSVSVAASVFNNANKLYNISGNLIGYLESVKKAYILEDMSKLNPICKAYVDELKSQRRKKKVCEYCGGSFYGLINKCCERCGRNKSY